VWRRAAATSAFVQKFPNELAPPSDVDAPAAQRLEHRLKLVFRDGEVAVDDGVVVGAGGVLLDALLERYGRSASGATCRGGASIEGAPPPWAPPSASFRSTTSTPWRTCPG
jgi:hypothetical protein